MIKQHYGRIINSAAYLASWAIPASQLLCGESGHNRADQNGVKRNGIAPDHINVIARFYRDRYDGQNTRQTKRGVQQENSGRYFAAPMMWRRGSLSRLG